MAFRVPAFLFAATLFALPLHGHAESASSQSVLRIVSYPSLGSDCSVMTTNDSSYLGSGVAIDLGDSNVTVATASHVLNSDKRGICVFAVTPSQIAVPLKLRFDDFRRDVAVLIATTANGDSVLRANMRLITSARIAEAPAVESLVNLIGYPFGTTIPTTYPASLLALHRDANALGFPEMLIAGVSTQQTSSVSEYGMSGGAAFDMQNAWLGLLVRHQAVLSANGNRSLSSWIIPATELLKLVRVFADQSETPLGLSDSNETGDMQQVEVGSFKVTAIGCNGDDTSAVGGGHGAGIGGGHGAGIGGGHGAGIGGSGSTSTRSCRLVVEASSNTNPWPWLSSRNTADQWTTALKANARIRLVLESARCSDAKAEVYDLRSLLNRLAVSSCDLKSVAMLDPLRFDPEEIVRVRNAANRVNERLSRVELAIAQTWLSQAPGNDSAWNSLSTSAKMDLLLTLKDHGVPRTMVIQQIGRFLATPESQAILSSFVPKLKSSSPVDLAKAMVALDPRFRDLFTYKLDDDSHDSAELAAIGNARLLATESSALLLSDAVDPTPLRSFFPALFASESMALTAQVSGSPMMWLIASPDSCDLSSKWEPLLTIQDGAMSLNVVIASEIKDTLAKDPGCTAIQNVQALKLQHALAPSLRPEFWIDIPTIDAPLNSNLPELIDLRKTEFARKYAADSIIQQIILKLNGETNL